MDRLPLTRATTLIFFGNFPTVYPSHSLSKFLILIRKSVKIAKILIVKEIPNHYKQKCQNCENPGLNRETSVTLLVCLNFPEHTTF